jgi:hypothetical protein
MPHDSKFVKHEGGEVKNSTNNLPKDHNLNNEIAKRLCKWKNIYILACLPFRILKMFMKTWFVSHVILFQEAVQYQDAILICHGRQVAISLSSQVFTNKTWVITKTIGDALMLVVKQFV